MNQIPHRRRDDDPQTGMRALMARKITVAWALLCCAVIFGSVALIGWSVKRNSDADRNRQAVAEYLGCVATNARRADARTVALSDVSSDRAIWVAIDALFPDGIPEPAHTTIFEGLTARERKIDSTYKATPCPIPDGLEGVDTVPPTTTPTS